MHIEKQLFEKCGGETSSQVLPVRAIRTLHPDRSQRFTRPISEKSVNSENIHKSAVQDQQRYFQQEKTAVDFWFVLFLQ